MLISEIFRQAINNLRSNKLRSILTIFGIVWGIVAIMVLLGWGFGFHDLMVGGFSQMGRQLIVFFPGHTSMGVGGYKAGRPVTPELKDLEALKTQCALVENIAPAVTWDFIVRHGNESREYDVRGIYPETKIINNWHVAAGRFISENDVKNRRRFAFLGHKVKETLFGKDSSAVGQEIKINRVTFTVIGVAVPKTNQIATINSRDDEQVLIPLSTAHQLWGDGKSLDMVFISLTDPSKSKQAVKEIRTIMAKLHNFDPEDEEALWMFDFNLYERMIVLLSLGLRILLGLIGTVTLFIGGVGVMNIMLVSVQERIHEIGIRKAVGARKRDIQLQFLAEALVITLLGGLLGWLLGSGLLGIVALLPLPNYIPVPINSPQLTGIVITILVLVGVISGYIPAKNAANLRPVQALQYERGEIAVGKKMPRPLWVSKTLTGELIGQSIMELRTSKTRSFLTMFGIFWGIAAVIILMGFGKGFQHFFDREFTKLGEKIIRVYAGRVKKEISGFRQGREIRFTEKDVQALNYFPREVEIALPEIDCRFLVVKYRNESRAVHTLGVVPETMEMRNFSIKEGRFINWMDVKAKNRVCFVGANIKEKLFGRTFGDVTGQYVRINGIRYRVIGSAEPKGFQMSIYTSLDDDKILIPYTTAMKDFRGTKYLSRILVSPVYKEHFDQCVEEINKVLGRIHGFGPDEEEAIYEYSELEGVKFLKYIVIGLQVFLGGVGVITLFIGGVGVMNVMFFIVTQRTREIGIRRAIGALKKHIFRQFLIEALLITFLGGAIGFVIGSGLNAILTRIVDVLRTQSVQMKMLFSPENSLLVSLITVFFMIAVGFFAGIMPALRAMQLNIVDSLRYE